MFVNRDRELRGLNNRYAGSAPEFFVLYGRRRTGKSALVREFCRGKPHVYFLAAQVRESDNLEQFRESLHAAYPDPLLASLRFTSWEAALTYAAEKARKTRFIVALDEFPYLCQDNPALPSLLQRWWDNTGKRSKVFLVLCGSQVGFMENQVLAERSPLYGRRTGQEHLRPLRPWDAALFFRHKYSVRDRLVAYGILGGIPAYLERFNPAHSIKTNLMREALDPQGFLNDEVHFLLRTELNQVTTYMSLLKAVAGGGTRLTDIASRANLAATAASRYLLTLRDLMLVRREVPFTEPHPEKSKRGLYVVEDPFVAFWCRFILPHQSLIQSGRGETVWQEFIAPVLNTHLGFVFEEVCRQYVLHRWPAQHGGVPRRVARWWSGNNELDVVAELADGKARTTLVGECKWWTAPVGRNVLDDLRERSRFLPEELQRNSMYALFSVSGFTRELRQQVKQDRVVLIDAQEILRTA